LSERERLKNPNRDLQDFQVWIDQVKLLVKIYGSSGLMTGFTGFTPALVRCRLPWCVVVCPGALHLGIWQLSSILAKEVGCH
jgi:hypothetical protein